MSGHVKSHTKHLPCDHGTTVKPSVRLPSFRDRHDGSSLAGISYQTCKTHDTVDVFATAAWVAGWLGGCLSHAGIVSKRLNLSKNFIDHLVAPSF